MKKKVLIFLIASFLFLQFVSAIDTEIKIMAPSNLDIKLEFINPDPTSTSGFVLDRQILNSGDLGETSYIFSTSVDTFNLHYSLLNNGTKIIDKTEKEITSGETLKLILIQGIEEVIRNYEESVVEETSIEETNATISEETETTTETTETNSETEEVNTESEKHSKFNPLRLLAVLKFSGFATSEDEESSSGFFYGSAVVVVFVLFIMFLVYKRKSKMKMHINNSSKINDDDSDYGRDFLDRRIDEMKDE